MLERKLKKTVSLAFFNVTNVLEHPGEGDFPNVWRWHHTSDFVLIFVFFLLSTPGTAGYLVGEEGCQGLVCPLLA